MGKFYFKPTREHYGLIKNELARQCNKKGEKIIIRDDLDGEWLWIDNSESLGELETGGKGFTKDRAALNLSVQRWWNDHKKNNFKVTPTLLMETMNGLAKSQLAQSQQVEQFATALNRHIPVYEGMRNEVAELKKTIKELRQEIRGMGKR